MITDKLDAFTRQYIETALWSSTDESTPEGGEPMDANYSIDDIAPETLQQMYDDCKKFHLDNAELIDLAISEGGELTTIMHDFWLTRNRHGAGFWDGDYSEELGKALTEAAHAFGEVNLYIGDDGKVWQS